MGWTSPTKMFCLFCLIEKNCDAILHYAMSFTLILVGLQDPSHMSPGPKIFLSTILSDSGRHNKHSTLTLHVPSTSKPLRFAYSEWCLFPNNDVEVTLAVVGTALSKSPCCVLTCSSDPLNSCCCCPGASASSRLSIAACAGAGSGCSGRVHRSYITLSNSNSADGINMTEWGAQPRPSHYRLFICWRRITQISCGKLTSKG